MNGAAALELLSLPRPDLDIDVEMAEHAASPRMLIWSSVLVYYSQMWRLESVTVIVLDTAYDRRPLSRMLLERIDRYIKGWSSITV